MRSELSWVFLIAIVGAITSPLSTQAQGCTDNSPPPSMFTTQSNYNQPDHPPVIGLPNFIERNGDFPEPFLALEPFRRGGPSFGTDNRLPPPPPGIGLPKEPLLSFSLPIAISTLTDEQVSKLAALKREHMETTAPLIVKLQLLVSRYRHALLRLDNLPELKKLGTQIATLKQELEQIRCDQEIALAQALTSEQRREIKLKIDKADLKLLPPQFR